MAKRSNHRTVVLLQDFATKSAGDEFTCDGMLARSLINRGIAEYKIEGEDLEINVEFKPLPEITEENNSSEKVSEPTKPIKQKSSSTKSKK